MKVLHIGKFYPPFHGGMENFLQDLVQAQVAAGLDVRVLVHNHKSHKTLIGLDGRVEIVAAGTLGSVFFTPVSPAFRSVLKRQLAEFRPDIIHIHMPNPSAFWVMTLASAKQIPWLLHWHADVVSSDLDWRVKAAYRFYRPLEQALLKRSSKVIATSPPYLDSSSPLAKWRDKCEVIPLGMGDRRLASSNQLQAHDWDAAGLRVLAIGRLTYYKGFEHLVRAAASLDSVQINLVGSGEKQRELQQLIAAHGLADKVKLLGKQPDGIISRLLQSCDCLCLPSIERTEAFGMVLLEAASFARPAVVSDVPGSGMGWVVREGETGFKVPPADVPALAAALQRMKDATDMRIEMGLKARQRFDEMFRIEQIERQVYDLYGRM
jgi:glycosyltransferase involved in cell wall biosynthesis